MLRVAVVGVGRLGSAHARVYSELPGVRLVGVLDTDLGRSREVADKLGVKSFSAIEDLFGEADAASVAVPTAEHFNVAAKLIGAGMSVLVEKPLAATLEQGRRLVEAAAAGEAKLAVGHVERFNPALVAAERYIKGVRFIEVRRVGPFSFRSMDIGVTMDLMIHDIDVILSLVDSPLRQVDAAGIPVLCESEDIASARLVFENGCVANVTASRVAVKAERKMHIFSVDAYVSIDMLRREALVYRKRPGLLTGEVKIRDVDPAKVKDPGKIVLRKFIERHRLKVARKEPLALELASFAEAVEAGREPLVTGEHGIRAMVVAEKILEKIRDYRSSIET